MKLRLRFNQAPQNAAKRDLQATLLKFEIFNINNCEHFKLGLPTMYIIVTLNTKKDTKTLDNIIMQYKDRMNITIENTACGGVFISCSSADWFYVDFVREIQQNFLEKNLRFDPGMNKFDWSLLELWDDV